MKFVNFIKSLVAPSANDQLAKLDPRLLADIGVSVDHNSTDIVRIPVSPLFAWFDPKVVYAY